MFDVDWQGWAYALTSAMTGEPFGGGPMTTWVELTDCLATLGWHDWAMLAWSAAFIVAMGVDLPGERASSGSRRADRA